MNPIDKHYMEQGYLYMSQINLQIANEFFHVENEAYSQLYSSEQGESPLKNNITKLHPIQHKIFMVSFEKKLELMRQALMYKN